MKKIPAMFRVTQIQIVSATGEVMKSCDSRKEAERVLRNVAVDYPNAGLKIVETVWDAREMFTGGPVDAGER